MTPAVSSAKLAASAGVLPVNIRVTGLSSRPPADRFACVTKKSPVAAMPVAANNTRFCRSQNRCVVASFKAARDSMIGMGAASAGSPEAGSRSDAREGMGEREEISTGCGETTGSGSGPCALVYTVVAETATNVSAKCLKLKVEKIFINDLCAIRILSLWTCTFASGFEQENSPEVSSPLITKATGRGGVSSELGVASFLNARLFL